MRLSLKEELIHSALVFLWVYLMSITLQGVLLPFLFDRPSILNGLFRRPVLVHRAF